jgi:hypothetical protein
VHKREQQQFEAILVPARRAFARTSLTNSRISFAERAGIVRVLGTAKVAVCQVGPRLAAYAADIAANRVDNAAGGHPRPQPPVV